MDVETRLKAAKRLCEEGVIRELNLYALEYQRFRRIKLPPDWETEDIVNEAIAQLLIGQRNWDCVKYPDVVVVVKGIIKSIFYHVPKLKYNTTRSRPKDAEGNVIDPASVSDQQGFVSKENVIQNLEFEETVSQFESALEGDKGATEVYFNILCGYHTPIELAEKMNSTVEEINVVLKRMRRKLKKVIEQGMTDEPAKKKR